MDDTKFLSEEEFEAALKPIKKQLKELDRRLAETTAKAEAAYIVTKSEVSIEEEWEPPAYELYPMEWRFKRTAPGRKVVDESEPLDPVMIIPEQEWDFIMDGFRIFLKKGVEAAVPQVVVDEIEWRSKERFE